mmetsp:Transcript_34210/g.45320  ORF Transcript_34210/g.45320 Transcript_34210/m.45320 type:complete len:365 (-) Transcript_34210:166-1260(-)
MFFSSTKILPFLLLVTPNQAFAPISTRASFFTTTSTSLQASNGPFDFLKNLLPKEPSSTATVEKPAGKVRRARELIRSLVEEEECFSTEKGAKAFGDVCAVDVLYEDCYEPQPILGRVDVTNHMLSKVKQRQNRGSVRIDRITDGDKACGFAWTWTSGTSEGLRGTTFIELNANTGEIQYIREIPEPLYKPGDLTLELLKAVTKDAQPKEPAQYEQRTPTMASDVAKYLFCDVQGSSVDESMRLFDDSIIYRDFNYEEVLRGKDEVRKFIEDFSFPGITFVPTKFDDGELSSCFTWEVTLEGAEDTIKGISLYEIDEVSRKITYVRDVPESAIKPPILGKLARQLRPGLGVFSGVPIGSREGGK